MHNKIPTYIKKSGHTLLLVIASLLFIATLIYSAFFIDTAQQVKANGACQDHGLSGWAWSGDNDPSGDGVVDEKDNNEIGGTGWISFSCKNDHDENTPGVQESSVDYGVDIANNGLEAFQKRKRSKKSGKSRGKSCKRRN